MRCLVTPPLREILPYTVAHNSRIGTTHCLIRQCAFPIREYAGPHTVGFHTVLRTKCRQYRSCYYYGLYMVWVDKLRVDDSKPQRLV